MIFIALGFLAVGWVAEKIFFRLTAKLRQRIETMPGMEGILRFWGALVNALPELLGLFIFAVTPLLTYFIVIDRQDRNLRLLFLAFLMVTVIIRFCALLLRLFFSPKMAKLRLVPLSCEVAQYLHRRLLFIVSAVGTSYVLLLLMSHLEVKWAAQIWLAIILTTTVIGLLAGMIWGNRVAVQEHLLGRKQIACEKRAWLREQYAAMWHILALAYLFLIWLLGFEQLVMADAMKFDGTFILSLLIVPIYLALDRLAQWCVISVFSKKEACRIYRNNRPKRKHMMRQPHRRLLGWLRRVRTWTATAISISPAGWCAWWCSSRWRSGSWISGGFTSPLARPRWGRWSTS
jgi:hypothetical protein